MKLSSQLACFKIVTFTNVINNKNKLMAKKLYISGNYLFKDNDDGERIPDYPLKWSFMTERSGDFTLHDTVNKTQFTITFADAVNWADALDGLSFHTEASMRTLLHDNTGKSSASGSGALTIDEFTVGAGGQTVFVTSKSFIGAYIFTEDGVDNVLRVSSQTNTNEVTTTTPVPEAVLVKITYIA